MKREFYPINISFKTRAVKVGPNKEDWIPVAKDFDLKKVVLQQLDTYEIAQKIDGSYYILNKEEG